MKNKKKIIITSICIVIGLFIGYFSLKSFSTTTGTMCLVRGTIGVPCPSCGMTRAVVAFMSGDIMKAFKYHPLFWLPFIAIILIVINRKYLKQILIIAGTLLIVVYILRMIIFFPHTEPMKINENSIIKTFNK